MISVENILKKSKNIAIIGLSDKPNRPSYQVAEYLISQGFNIIPVNPTINFVFGLKSYPSFSDIPKDIKIDIVDIFRKSDQVLLIVEEIIKSKQKPIIWFQEGILNLEAEKLAKKNGFEVINGLCLMKTHQKDLK
ncbi:MAG: CoA-binding protein [Candidatus Shapirobacteria bacterium]|nr:CoA-binding protein [Candidatus Shapirobacteria bacterium]